MCFIRRPDVRIQHVDGEMLVLDDDNGFIHQFNESASFVWGQCDGKSSISEIASRLAIEYNLDVALATKDVSQAIKTFRNLNLVNERTR